jgi:MoxR-like ATPase
MQGRAFVIPEDVQSLAIDIMGHRIGLTYEAEAENITTSDVIKKIINRVAVP